MGNVELKKRKSNSIVNAEEWQGNCRFRVCEKNGLSREKAIVDFGFEIKLEKEINPEKELALTVEKNNEQELLTAQFYDLKLVNKILTGKVVCLIPFEANEEKILTLFYGNDSFNGSEYDLEKPLEQLSIQKGNLGPNHYTIENEFYKLNTMPKSGHLWHLWNKKGANESWHFIEWEDSEKKGGDPFHWSPNCWVAHPDRVSTGYNLSDGGESDLFDWHYAFGWENPKIEVIQGPCFIEIKRQGPIPPHPEHSNPNAKRSKNNIIEAEIIYRFYVGLPIIYQYSKMNTLEDLNCFFIRNCQFALLSGVFNYAILAPENKNLKPHDFPENACIRLMGPLNYKPYDNCQHSLSNVVPGKLNYWAMFNDKTGDGYSCFHITEDNTNIYSGKPVYQNHTTLLSELYNWAGAFSRAFSYTNRRFNPENATFLPKGEQYIEENYCLLFPHKDIHATETLLGKTSKELNNPVVVEEVGL